MHLRCCFYFSGKEEFKDFYNNNARELKLYSSRLRCCILLNSENKLTTSTFHANAVISVYDVFANFLLYEMDEGRLAHPKEPVISGMKHKHWIQDIDVWIGLPQELKAVPKLISPHIYCYDNLREIRVG